MFFQALSREGVLLCALPSNLHIENPKQRVRSSEQYARKPQSCSDLEGPIRANLSRPLKTTFDMTTFYSFKRAPGTLFFRG